jgi:hypothetical protein
MDPLNRRRDFTYAKDGRLLAGLGVWSHFIVANTFRTPASLPESP